MFCILDIGTAFIVPFSFDLWEIDEATINFNQRRIESDSGSLNVVVL